jgi:ferrous iron transport protein B
MRIALIGQPNCGKSTLFNQVAGYKAETGNFHGTTVTFTESKVRVSGEVIDLVDLPGTYTLSGTNPAEAETQRYLKSEQVDLIINVVDASHLSQGLELTLELLQLNRPLLVAFNMMDEARRTGLHINGPALQERLGVTILPLIASKGQGVMELFKRAVHSINNPVVLNNPISANSDLARHELAASLTNEFVSQGEHRISWRDRFDDLLLHPLWGYFSMAVILYLFFQIVYRIGTAIEGPVLAVFNDLTDKLLILVGGGHSLLGELAFGLLQGISGGLAIALPYLVPFLFGLGLLEDIGYLPRIAFLMDGLMHRLGLHGKAIVPFILGYGCNVPAVMSTRILEEKQDRFLASALAVLVPCAARLAVIFGLVAFYLGPTWAMAIYLFNIIVIALLGRILTNLLPEKTPGLILEMPVYRIPTFKTVFSKTWFRVREFLFEAWPLLIIGSVALGLFTYFNINPFLNLIVRPVTWLMGLPSETGVPLIFGVLRKELSLIMLRQALGGADFASVLTPLQMMTFTVFVVFYIPCLPTLSSLRQELGIKQMLLIVLLTILVAISAGLFVRILGILIL